MSAKVQKILLGVSAVLILSSSMVLGIFLSGNFKNVFGLVNNESSSVSETQTVQQTEVILKVKTAKPSKIRGVWLTAGVDYLSDISDSVEEIKSDIEKKISDISAIGFNTVFFDYTADAEQNLFSDDIDGSSIFNYCLEYTRKSGLFIVVCLPIDSYVSGSNEFIVNEETFGGFCKKYNTDAILMSGLSKLQTSFTEMTSSQKNTKMIEIITNLSVIARASDSNIIFSTQLDTENLDIQYLASNIFVNGINDFIYVEPSVSSKDKSSPYADILTKIDKAAITAGGECVYGQRADFLFSGDSWSDPNEIITQVKAAESMGSCSGIAVRSYSSLKSDKQGSSTAFLKYFNNLILEKTKKEFVIYNQKTTDISTSESKISFTGGCNPEFPLLCNNNTVILTEAGDFSVEFDLKVGKNAFVFKQNDKSYIYNVTYKMDILKSVSPKGEMSGPGGTVIEISTVALRNAEVNAVINKNTVSMVQSDTLDFGDEEKSPDNSSDFVTYYGKYTLPEGKASAQNLGAINVTAKFNGLSKTLTGAKVTVAAKPFETTMPTTEAPTAITTETTAAQTETSASTGGTDENTTNQNETTQPPVTSNPVQEELLTPGINSGLGTSRMCEITLNNCETFPISPLNDHSVPISTPLLSGMFDYIDGESSFDGFLYYNLRSGRRVYRNQVKVIENGYNLPSNNIKVMNSATSGDTYINLAMTWKIPVSVLFRGQVYPNINMTDSRDFSVWSFTGNCIDFTFYYTGNMVGDLNVSGSNVIGSVEWIKNAGENTVTLRLNLKRAGVFYGYSIGYNSDNSLRISIKNKPSASLSGYTIMLDPGHCGIATGDKGATCSSKTPDIMMYEGQINLILARKIKERLESNGVTVLMTRSDDSDVSLDNRRKLVYEKKPDLFISVHCDSSDKSTSAIGTSAYYYNAQSFPLADALHKQIFSCYSNKIYATDDRKTQFYPFRVTRVEACPSVLIEYGFVSNLIECQALQNDTNQNSLAEATVQGIIDYINAY